jgi:hypothetical protein
MTTTTRGSEMGSVSVVRRGEVAILTPLLAVRLRRIVPEKVDPGKDVASSPVEPIRAEATWLRSWRGGATDYAPTHLSANCTWPLWRAKWVERRTT